MEQEELLQIYFAEAEELIQSLERSLMALEESPQDEDIINEAFRAAHTMKSSAAMVGFQQISEFTHTLENVLDRLRNKDLAVTNKLISLLLEANDFLKHMVENASSGEAECEPEKFDHMKGNLERFLGVEAMEVEEEVKPIPPPAQKDHYYKITMVFRRDLFNTGQDPLMLFVELEELGEILKVEADLSQLPSLDTLNPYEIYISWKLVIKTKEVLSKIKDVFIFVEEDNTIEIEDVTKRFSEGIDVEAAHKLLGEILLEEGLVSESDLDQALEGQKKLGEILVEQEKISHKELEKALDIQKGSRIHLRRSTVRVDTEKLDKLVNLVEEIAIGISQLNVRVGLEPSATSIHVQENLENLDKIGRELQEQVMRLRLFPIEGTFNRFQRLIRDLAHEQGKKVKVIINGGDTELDKDLVEQVGDSLKHLVRNCVDHGIEPPHKRKEKGKAEEGTVELKAFQKGGKIFIEINDDGRGINEQAIVEKAVRSGLLEKGSPLTKQEAYQLIFEPGLSTSNGVTDISGRGVGLDVVKTNINQLGGSINISSETDKGTTFSISIPLTLAIMDGMKIRVEDEVFIIPVRYILGSFQVREGDIKTIEAKGEVVDFREQCLPLVRLNQALGLGSDGLSQDGIVVIVDAEVRRMGFLVDEILGEQQIVIKSLDKNFRRVPGIAGATILGDGTVSLILDIYGLERKLFNQ